MVKRFVRSIQALAVVAAMSAAAFVGSNAMGAAVTGDSPTGTLPSFGNSAVTFDPTTATPVVVRFTDPNLNGATRLQLGFRSSDASFTSLPGPVEYSYDNVSYTTFYAGASSIGANPSYSYNGIVNVSSTSQNIYFKYTIPANAMGYSKTFNIRLLANNNGATDAGVLADATGNGFTDLTRTNTSIAAPSVPEPTTFAIASIGLGLAGAARMRKRAKKA